MKQKFFLIASMLFAMTAWATDYIGTVTTSSNSGSQSQDNISVTITNNGDGTYNMHVDRFYMQVNGKGAYVGPIDYSNLEGTTGSDGYTTVSGSAEVGLDDIPGFRNLIPDEYSGIISRLEGKKFPMTFEGRFNDYYVTASSVTKVQMTVLLVPIINETITVSYQGEVQYNVPDAEKLMETFEQLPIGLAAGTEAQGDIATWKTGNATIAHYDGSRQVEMKLPSTVQMTTPINHDVVFVTVELNNPQNVAAKVSLYSSVDNGNKWTILKTVSGAEQVLIAAGAKAKPAWQVNFSSKQPPLFRLAMVSGSKTLPCYADNFTVYYTPDQPEPSVLGDINGDGIVDVSDVNIAIDIVLGRDSNDNYDGRADLDGNGMVDVSDVNAIIDIVLGK